jgi:hypothetical protein
VISRALIRPAAKVLQVAPQLLERKSKGEEAPCRFAGQTARDAIAAQRLHHVDEAVEGRFDIAE